MNDKEDPTKVHAVLPCPECESMCKPLRNTKDGGACYKCNNEDGHDDSGPLSFRIDGDGELYF